ncbi:2-C-methyl-D-erythritol 4-phosphate cytidylyltransferase [Arsenicicoccus piscis]|uniref:2-C-methyl-D-erythritol 4-phosphate cytidylyltransferase n=1 Tax=Arsenicicoccus piscis TaxID=673954 RepID=A0ABQ6HQN2_9MICO|nr:2-C-methyl-D-erythritol 4-phosphate cytidylyltransferase [Arsenicicoccus piscis]
MSTVSVAVVIVAAGLGTRLGHPVPKAFVEVGGRSLLAHAVDRVVQVPGVDQVVVVVPDAFVEDTWALLDTPLLTVVSGGADRTASVAAGLSVLVEHVDVVLVHDAARCFTPPDVFEAVVAAVRSGDVAVVPGLPVIDTVKEVDADGLVRRTPARASLRAVQTPQGFDRVTLDRAHASGTSATDDAALIEALGLPVRVVPGSDLAFKVTTPDDLDRAHAVLTTSTTTTSTTTTSTTSRSAR